MSEEMRLIDLINSYGQKWKEIQKEMSNRSCSQLKNRFFGRLKKLNDKKREMVKVEAEGSVVESGPEQMF